MPEQTKTMTQAEALLLLAGLEKACPVDYSGDWGITIPADGKHALGCSCNGTGKGLSNDGGKHG